jgi:hypothetical protein
MFIGINGGSAAGGGNGGDGIEAKHLILDIKGTLNVTAGNGGQGGKGGNGSNAVGGSLVEPDCGGDGGSGASGGDGGYCFNIETYSIINYANGTLKAGSAGNGGDGGKGGSSHNSLFYGPGIGSHGGSGGDAGTQGDIGFTIEGGIPENLNYIGSYTAKGGKIGSAGYDGDGAYAGDKEYIYAGDGSQGILFGKAWEENK